MQGGEYPRDISALRWFLLISFHWRRGVRQAWRLVAHQFLHHRFHRIGNHDGLGFRRVYFAALCNIPSLLARLSHRHSPLRSLSHQSSAQQLSLLARQLSGGIGGVGRFWGFFTRVPNLQGMTGARPGKVHQTLDKCTPEVHQHQFPGLVTMMPRVDRMRV